jgi:hypothetical protein
MRIVKIDPQLNSDDFVSSNMVTGEKVRQRHEPGQPGKRAEEGLITSMGMGTGFSPLPFPIFF